MTARQVMFHSSAREKGISLLSYNKQVHFGVIADRQLIPAPAELAASFTAEFERLVRETLRKT